MPLVAADSVSWRGKIPSIGFLSRSFSSFAMRSFTSWAVSPIGQSSTWEVQSAAKLSSASWKPSACPSVPCSAFCVGSTTASKTARPTFLGNRWA